MTNLRNWQEGAIETYDSNGNVAIEMSLCNHCGNIWNDALITERTPAPSGRCPFEDEHNYPRTRRDKDRLIENYILLEHKINT